MFPFLHSGDNNSPYFTLRDISCRLNALHKAWHLVCAQYQSPGLFFIILKMSRSLNFYISLIPFPLFKIPGKMQPAL